MRSTIRLAFLFCVVVLLNAWAAEDPDLTKAKEKVKARTEELEKLLKDSRVTYTFEDPSFRKAIDFLKGKFPLEIVIDPVVDLDTQKVPVEVIRNMSLKSALDLICGDGLKCSTMGEAIYISTAEGMGKVRARWFSDPKEPTKAQEKLLLATGQFRTGVDFQNKPAKDAIAFLAGKSKVKIDVLPADEIDAMTVTVSVKDASLRSLLDLVCGSRLGWSITESSVIVGLPEKVAETVEKQKPKEQKKDGAKKPATPKAVKKDDAKGVEKKDTPKDTPKNTKKGEKTTP